MIGGLVEAIRQAVAIPQATVEDVERRAWDDPDASPIGAHLAELDVVGLTSTPINPEIGSGFGAGAGGVVTLRHLVALVVTVEDTDAYGARVRLDAIVTDLFRRAYMTDWVNLHIADDQDVQSVQPAIEYADLESDTNNAYATLTFTVDAEWRL